MEREKIIYLIYTLFFLALMLSISAVPLLAFSNDVDAFYKAFGYTCHQKLSRSYCLFSDAQYMWVADCTPQEGKFITHPADNDIIMVRSGNATGYKFPVCSRDVGLYGAMLFGALAYPVVRELKDRVPNARLFILALVPIALDGGLQFLSVAGILPYTYESTNLIRFVTGAIAGFASSFYAIPILIAMFGDVNKNPGAGKQAGVGENQEKQPAPGKAKAKPQDK